MPRSDVWRNQLGSFVESAWAIWFLEKAWSVADDGSARKAAEVRAAFSAASIDKGLDLVLSSDCESGRLCHDNGAVLRPGDGMVEMEVTLVRFDSESNEGSFSLAGEFEMFVIGLSMVPNGSSRRDRELSRTGEDLGLMRSEICDVRCEGGGGVFAGDDF